MRSCGTQGWEAEGQSTSPSSPLSPPSSSGASTSSNFISSQSSPRPSSAKAATLLSRRGQSLLGGKGVGGLPERKGLSAAAAAAATTAWLRSREQASGSEQYSSGSAITSRSAAYKEGREGSKEGGRENCSVAS